MCPLQTHLRRIVRRKKIIQAFLQIYQNQLRPAYLCTMPISEMISDDSEITEWGGQVTGSRNLKRRKVSNWI